MYIGQVSFPGARGYTYDGIIFVRDPFVRKDKNGVPEKSAAKPFSFNIPATLIVPLKNALSEILTNSAGIL